MPVEGRSACGEVVVTWKESSQVRVLWMPAVDVVAMAMVTVVPLVLIRRGMR